jgi:transcriptional regulator with XRE-family HTH domain
MEFHEKLQILRKQKNITQEQLAKKLYVSRTAVSKWESGKGYPNIDSLKCIAKEFDVSIDELLSGDEWVALAETESKRKVRYFHNIAYAVMDMLALSFIFLPFYGKQVGDYVQSVNLLQYSGGNPFVTAMFFVLLSMMFAVGVAEFALFNRLEKGRDILHGVSFLLHGLTVLFFALSRQPYATAFLFLFLTVKIILKIAQKRIR